MIGIDPKVLSCCLIAAVLIGVTGSSVALASLGTTTGTMRINSMALPSSVATGMSARRTGPKTVHLIWMHSGANPKGFYLFHVASATTPPADFLKGGWSNDLIVEGTARQADLNVSPAAKPQHNYYLICIAGTGTSYACSDVVVEQPSMTAPAPMVPIPH